PDAEKVTKKACPGVRPSLRSGSLAPALLRGPAATGHPWPIAALPASMPVDPLLRTSSRPPEGAGRSKALRPEAADRPACSVRVYCAISVDTLLQVKPYLWERACSRTTFASRLAPTVAVFLGSGYRNYKLTFFRDFSHRFANCWGEGTTLIVGVRR
ncbi:hypothetical protein GHO42_01885, partial [Pseudomonas sp. FSL R10-0056]|nr:hypothetical protein [Pseudomonas sp. FSL R10-0056]